jgi:predicted AlkP superfamily phosphohydrolase/phosphomutase
LRDQLRSYWATSRIDWSQTRAFHLPTDLLGYVRINLKGREPKGIVESGAEYDEICGKVSSVLKELLDPRTGKRIVRDVFQTNKIFAGPEENRLPDLIVTWRDEVNRSDSLLKACIKNGDLPDPRSGNHRPEGFALFYGPGFGKGSVGEGHIVDIAPTILKYFGLTPPSDIDGQPLGQVYL